METKLWLNCFGDGYWVLGVQDAEEWVIQQEWLEAIHTLTSWAEPGGQVALKDFQAAFHDHGLPAGRLDLSMIGWGLPCLFCDLSKEEAAATHAATAPVRLDELECAWTN